MCFIGSKTHGCRLVFLTGVAPGIAWRWGYRPRQGGLNQRGRDHAPFIITLVEGRKHHVIFRKNNLNFWLETVYF